MTVSEFFLEWEIFETKGAENIKMPILCSVPFFFFLQKSYRVWDSIKKCGGAREAAVGNIAVRFMLKATRAQAHASARAPTSLAPHTSTHSPMRPHTQKYVILIAFSRQQLFRERASLLRHTYVASFDVCNERYAVRRHCFRSCAFSLSTSL